MKRKRILVPFMIIVVALITACAPDIETAKVAADKSTVMMPTATLTQTQEPSVTLEPTATLTPISTSTPTLTRSSNQMINELITKENYAEAIEVTKQAVESGEYASLNEAILEIWLPVIREQTDYSDRVIASLSPRLNGLELNEHGMPAIYDEEGNLLIEKTVPGISNVKWAIPLMELTTNRFPSEDLKERADYYFDNQFKEGLPFDSRAGLYDVWVVIDDEVQLESEFELPDGQKITTLLRCYYYDATGNLQMINIPFYAYDSQKLSVYIITSGGVIFDSLDELNEWVGTSENAAKIEKGPRTIEGIPNIESGQIFLIGFNMSVNPALLSTTKEFFHDSVASFHTQEALDAFAQTGDPSHLPNVPVLGEPLLIPLYDVGDTIFD